VGVDSIQPTLCDRCLAALAEMKLAAETEEIENPQ
jgi:hypothetical protein